VIYSYDSRDDPTNPRKGLVTDFLLSGAGSVIGSDVEFVRATARALYLRPIGRSTLRLAARAGIIDPSGNEELPIDIRFFSGGAQSVRSFRERDLGPKDRNNYPIGGEFVTVFNVEYEIPVAGPFSVAPFFDAGNLLRQAEDAGFGDMHYAGGLGIILNSPIGPLRIDYGHNLNQGENEPSGSWHIGFGVAF
jgi:outer membrane protein insertion porin family